MTTQQAEEEYIKLWPTATNWFCLEGEREISLDGVFTHEQLQWLIAVNMELEDE
jgi:hypothetical protein